MSWEVVFGRNEMVVPVETFKEACKILFDKNFRNSVFSLSKTINQSTGGVRIERADHQFIPHPISAADAEKIAFELNWIRDGEWTG